MTVAYINYELRTRYLPVAYTTQMADKARRARLGPEETVKYTLHTMYTAPYFVVLEVALSSHYCYFDNTIYLIPQQVRLSIYKQ